MAERNNEAFLKKVRDRYRKASDYWKPIKDEAAEDMKYITGDPWTEKEKEARRQQHRPALASDELQQYLNQVINQGRQQKRGIKIMPKGAGSNDQTATLLQDIIRSIEYNSVAQENAYIPADEDQIQRSYGFYRLTRQYVGDTFRQEIIIKGIPDADSVLFDPCVREADWSDAEYVFVLNPLPKEEFKRKYPKASLTGFDDERIATDWIREDTVMEAEYWEIEKTERTRLVIATPEGNLAVWEDELDEKPDPEHVVNSRPIETKKVTQYILNGVEILEEIPQPGTIIPIFAVIGKEMWVPEGGKSSRKLFSLIRLAREPYKQYCYAVTLLNEELAQIPKTKVVGPVGTFKTDKEGWETSAFTPHPFLQYDVITDASTGNALPPPQIWQYAPNAQSFAVVMDDARRRIMSALGLTPLPTAAQRRNDKSGVALERIEQQESLGAFHFTANSDRAKNLCGRCLLEWIPETYSDEREMMVPKEDGTTRKIRINSDAPYEDEDGQMAGPHKVSDDLEHMVTISTGPSYQSQRDAADDFIEQLLSNLAALPLDPPSKAKLLSLAVKLKDLGPLGDAMAEVISPDDPNAPQLYAQKLQQAQQHLQAINAYAQQLEGELQKMNMEKQAKVIDNQYKARIEEMKIQAQVTIAEIETKAQAASERLKWERETYLELHGDAHELGMQKDQQAHEQDLAQQQALQAQQAQAADQQHQQEMAAQQSDQPQPQE